MFQKVRDKLIENFNHIVWDHDLYETDLDKDELWNIYLRSFPTGTNPIYRTNTKYDCSSCRHFIKAIGNLVWIDEETMGAHSIFEFDTESTIYQPVMNAMATYVVKHPIRDVYFAKERRVGHDYDRELIGDEIETFHHFYVDIPDRLLYNNARDNRFMSIESAKSDRRDSKNVFQRALNEISMDAIDTVLELAKSKTLYRGEEWINALIEFRKSKEEYERIDPDKRDIYAWLMSSKIGYNVARIRNHSIGVLLTDISNEIDLEEAVRKYEAIVAPANYKRPKTIFTKKMLEDAQKKVEELGYMNSLERRFARIDDINVHDILFSNKDAAKHIEGNVFDDLMKSAKTAPKNFSRVEKIKIERFIKDVLPMTNEMEVYFENRHAPNLVSLIAPVHKEAKSMFKWGNGFSWAYTGNIADSDIKANVKKAGGMVNAALRFSIQWNDGLNEYDQNDLDAHCIESAVYGHKKEIYFGDMYSSKTGGKLDVDIIHPVLHMPAVENIVYPTKDRMLPGRYAFSVHCYSDRGGASGFRAEIEFDGKIYRFNYTNKLRANESVRVATVEMDSNGNFSIIKFLSSEESSREIWGLTKNQFIPVSVMMNSPNYWSLNDGKEGVGNKHYMFMLDGCINPEKPNGFYNEYLKNELVEHKRVFEALGSKMAVGESNDQLSGLGFSSTKRNDIVVKVKGSIERTMKVIF